MFPKYWNNWMLHYLKNGYLFINTGSELLWQKALCEPKFKQAEAEYKHAKLVADRIIELEGVPVLNPKKWFELARCQYSAPDDFDVQKILFQNVIAERCAIKRYEDIASFTEGIDFTTCNMAKFILAEEEDHEQDLQDYLDDIARMKKDILNK